MNMDEQKRVQLNKKMTDSLYEINKECLSLANNIRLYLTQKIETNPIYEIASLASTLHYYLTMHIFKENLDEKLKDKTELNQKNNRLIFQI